MGLRRPSVWTGHVALRSRDAAVAARIYGQVGMRPVEVGEHFAVLEVRGGRHMAIRDDREHAAPGPVAWDLMAEDLDAIRDHGQALGLPVTVRVAGPPPRSFQLTDQPCDRTCLASTQTHGVRPR